MYIRKNKYIYMKNPKLIIKEIKLIKKFSSYHNVSFMKSRHYLRKYFRTVLGRDFNKFIYKDAIDRTMEILNKSNCNFY